MVFLCGPIIPHHVTKIRKMIILAIPESLQHAIGGGIGLFVAYVGMLNVGSDQVPLAMEARRQWWCRYATWSGLT